MASTGYRDLVARLARGWNTWNTRSVTSHVLLPGGYALNLGLVEPLSGHHRHEFLIGRFGAGAEEVRPIEHAYDGAYIRLEASWFGVNATFESCHEGGDLLVLATPTGEHSSHPMLVIQAGILWNRAGTAAKDGEVLVFRGPSGEVRAWGTGAHRDLPFVEGAYPYLALELNGPAGLSTGRKRPVAEIRAALDRARKAHLASFNRFGEHAELVKAIHWAMAWDTIFEPEKQRVVSPVSRLWNINWGGYVLFCWDTYFAAFLASIENRDLAFANAIEMTNERTEEGFVPNFATVRDIKSRDRSQPPVGAMMAREIYRKHREKWFLEELFEPLLGWNRWWEKRRDNGGWISPGSNRFKPRLGSHFEVHGIADRQGAAYETGLDNATIYDGVPFNESRGMMELADVGFTGLYVADCRALAAIARELGRTAEAAEVEARGARYDAKLAELWDDRAGMFLNRRTDTGEAQALTNITNFYGLLGGTATQAQAERMAREHLLDPGQYGGEWMVPVAPRNDPAFGDQEYWRGRIWGPTNWLLYLGLRNYDLPEARRTVADRSAALFLKEWTSKGHVHENYNAITGEGCDSKSSDRFYHWGALLALPALIEAGVIEGPERPL